MERLLVNEKVFKKVFKKVFVSLLLAWVGCGAMAGINVQQSYSPPVKTIDVAYGTVVDCQDAHVEVANAPSEFFMFCAETAPLPSMDRLLRAVASWLEAFGWYEHEDWTWVEHDGQGYWRTVRFDIVTGDVMVVAVVGGGTGVVYLGAPGRLFFDGQGSMVLPEFRRWEYR